MRYWIDSNDRIVRVDDEWYEFARENYASSLTADAVCGRPLSSFISDATTAEIWMLLLGKARIGYSVSINIRCDAPDRRRTLRLLLSKDEDLTCVTSTLVQEELRPPVALLDDNRPTSEEMLPVCSWCKKVQLPANTWVEVEIAINQLGLFESDRAPAVTHSICPSCLESLNAEIAQLKRGG
jgi:hypothetical protein